MGGHHGTPSVCETPSSKFADFSGSQKISEQVLVSVLQADLFPNSQAYSLTLENISTTSKWEQLIHE